MVKQKEQSKKLIKCVLAENNSNNLVISSEIIDEDAENDKIDYNSYLKPGKSSKFTPRESSQSPRDKTIRKWNFS